MPNQIEAKRDGMRKPTKLRFQSILKTENPDALKTLFTNRKRRYHLATHTLGDLCATINYTHKEVEILKDTFTKMDTPFPIE